MTDVGLTPVDHTARINWNYLWGVAAAILATIWVIASGWKAK